MVSRRKFRQSSEAKVWETIVQGPEAPGYDFAVDEIAKRYYNLVLKCAQRKHSGTPRTVNLAELQSDAQLAFLDAIRRYDPSVGSPFSSWAYLKMNGGMQDGLRKLASQKAKPVTNADVPIENLNYKEAYESSTSDLAQVSMVTAELLFGISSLKDDDLDLIYSLLSEPNRTKASWVKKSESNERYKKLFNKILWSVTMGKSRKNDIGIARRKDMEIVDHGFYSTGNLRIDKVLGGGFAGGRIIELFGAEGSGKTSLSLACIGEAQKRGKDCLFIDLEGTFNDEFATVLGVDVKELWFSHGDVAENTLQAVIDACNAPNISIIVVDSVANLVPLVEDEGEIGQANIGALPRVMGQAMRKISTAAQESGTCVIFINQTRSTISSFGGGGKTTPGGVALKFQASQRVEVTRINKIADKKTGVIIGGTAKVHVVKNKLAPPMQKTEVEFFYDSGFSNDEALVEDAIERGTVVQKGSWYSDSAGNQIGQGRDAAVAWIKSQEG